MTRPPATVIAVLGKGGAGKTVLSALAVRAVLDLGKGPLLLIDADPTGGLSFAVNEAGAGRADAREGVGKTMGEVRAELIRKAGRSDPEELARRVDWMALEALQERDGYSLLSMGRTDTKGCFCSVNKLLRQAIENLVEGYEVVILDAEAGIEQVNRQVVGRVDIPLVVTDGSLRGLNAADQIAGLLKKYRFGKQGGLVVNRASTTAGDPPDGLPLLATVPEDDNVRAFDCEGRSLLDLPADSPALAAIRPIVEGLLT